MTKKNILIRVVVLIIIMVALTNLIVPHLDEQLYRKFICCTVEKNATSYNVNGQEVYLDGAATEADLMRFTTEFEQVIGYGYDYKIVLTTYDIANTYMYGEQIGEKWEIVATTDTFAKIIYINTEHIEEAVLHELAHTIDLKYKFSENSFLLDLYNKEETQSYMTFSPYEYFAENYQMYLKNTLENPELKKWYEEMVIPTLKGVDEGCI